MAITRIGSLGNRIIGMSRTLKIVIVEDEPIAEASLKKLISDTGIDYEIVSTLNSVSDCLLFFGKQIKYDLIFMDIHLKDDTCFELLNSITIEKPIVFLTTFDSYAIKVFEYNSIDYIVKPAKLQDIQDALKKYWFIKKVDKAEYLSRIDEIAKNLNLRDYKKRFLIRIRNMLKVIDVEQISCFYSEEGQTYLVDYLEKNYMVEFTMERLEYLLNPKQFFRINRKVIISINEIKSIEDYFNNRLKIQLKRGRLSTDLIVSRPRIKDFKNWLMGKY